MLKAYVFKLIPQIDFGGSPHWKYKGLFFVWSHLIYGPLWYVVI